MTDNGHPRKRTSSRPLFHPGVIVVTPGAADVLSGVVHAFALIWAHVHGDWGVVDADDARANARALRDGARLLSAYMVGETKVWVITEADRSVTTILLPSEY